MPELTREEKLKLVEKLPQQLQDFLYSEDTGAFLLYLGQKYNLPDEKVRLLSKLVGDVVLGIVPITSLAQEINSKITSDAQAAMNLAQELNTELLTPVMVPVPSAPAPTAAVPPTPQPVTSTPRPVDEYREPAFSVPEIVDLRNQPKAGSRLNIGQAPRAETPPMPSLPPKPMTAPLAPAPAPTSPLTFTRPVEPVKPAAPATPVAPATPAPQPVYAGRPSLIEADPHLPAKISPEISADKIPAPALKPQYIMRPSGAPPTDPPDNVLDLRKDKGEF